MVIIDADSKLHNTNEMIKKSHDIFKQMQAENETRYTKINRIIVRKFGPVSPLFTRKSSYCF